jgi:Spy/CpxP family protein refolding chaperone
MRSFGLRFLMAALAVVLGTALAKSQTADAAQPAPASVPAMHHHGYGMGDHWGFRAKALNLTDDQKTQMKAIMQKEHPVMKPLFQQSHQIDLQLRQYAEGTYDEAKVRALAAQKAQLEVELAVQKTRIHNEMFQVLTADQQAKMKDFEARREARMAERMQQTPPAPPEQ